MTTQASFNQPYSQPSDRIRQVESIAWAIFFIWIGVAILAQVSWGWFLIGVAVLTLAAEFVRWQIGGKIDAFWVACGIVFLAGGLWNVLDLPWPLAPILLILFGVVMIGKAVVRR